MKVKKDVEEEERSKTSILEYQFKTMTQRKSISKKFRFEVFKRDSFTCQYCGSKAPDVILEVDHIVPVSENGTNEILNLITSCFDCNRGKTKTLLSDHTILDKQRNQIEELNLRRQQLEMMLDWKNELIDLKDNEFNSLIDYIHKLAPEYELNDYGEKLIQKLLNTNGFEKALKAIEISFNQYYLGKTLEEYCLAIDKVGGVANIMDRPPHEKRIAYIIGILKNRFIRIDIAKARRLMINVYESNPSPNELDDVEQKAKTCYKFEYFCDYLKNFDY